MEARVVTDIREFTKVAQGRPVHSSHEHLASPRLVLPFPWHYFVTFTTLSSVLTCVQFLASLRLQKVCNLEKIARFSIGVNVWQLN